MKEFLSILICGILLEAVKGGDPETLFYLDDVTGNILDGIGTTRTGAPVGPGIRGDVAFSMNSGMFYYVLDGRVYGIDAAGNSIGEIPFGGGADVQDIEVCCDRIFAVLSHSGNRYSIVVHHNGYTKTLFQFEERLCPPRIAVSCIRRRLYYTTDNGIISWDFMDINNPTSVFATLASDNFLTNSAFGSCPLSVEYAEELGTVTPQLYFTLASSNSIFEVTMASGIGIFRTITSRDQVFYIAATGSLCYSSVEGSTHIIEAITRDGTGGVTLVSNTARATGMTTCDSVSFFALCNEQCPPESPCTSCPLSSGNRCGTCLPGIGTNFGNCFCDNPFQKSCEFSDALSFPVGCTTGPTPNELICAVVNPLAVRRPPARDIILHGLVGSAMITPENIGATYAVELDRAVPTGRWTELPDQALPIRYTNDQRKGLVFHPRKMSQGQRFGVFAARLVQSNVGRVPGYVLTETLCIAQENSKIWTPVYTAIGHQPGLPITLTAYIPPDRLRRVRWSVTDTYSEVRRELLQGVGQRSITLDSVLENAGIYEAYVEPRYLKTWHAIFHVIIRSCDSVSFGADCAGQCPSCPDFRGVCDTASGECLCFPGYRDSLDPAVQDRCSDNCPLGMIGRDCSISCDIEFGQPGCKNTLLCLPEPVGCHCFQETATVTGLVPPHCACPPNRWGPDCNELCDCNPGFLCDAVEGCIPNYTM